MSATATGITVQAWIDGGTSEPETTVSLTRSEYDGLYELAIQRSVSTVLLDADSLHHLLGWVRKQDES